VPRIRTPGVEGSYVADSGSTDERAGASPDPEIQLSERQRWAIQELATGVQLQRVLLEQKFGVSDKTGKRDLSDLARRGKIEYVRRGRDGYYRLAAVS
jgi:hypothetical protein